MDELTQEKIFKGIDAGVRNHVLVETLGVSDQDIIDVMWARHDYFKTVEEEYWDKEWPKVLTSIGEMTAEVPQWERREDRRRYLQERMRELKERFELTGDEREELERIIWEARIHVGEAEGISPEQVERARMHPMEKLIKSVRGMAKCPFHNDKTPSMDVRKGFYFCYGCGEHGDAIEFVMKTQNLRFKEAVELLGMY